MTHRTLSFRMIVMKRIHLLLDRIFSEHLLGDRSDIIFQTKSFGESTILFTIQESILTAFCRIEGLGLF
jgi:hypothetical protein